MPTLTPSVMVDPLSVTPASLRAPAAADLALRYDHPATSWEQEALPIGNGYLGAMLFGGIATDQIQFNEESLWIGDESDTGAYQAFGDIWVRFGAAAGAQPAAPSPASAGVAQPAGPTTTGYRRELDLTRAVHSVGYVQAGVTYRREAFASYPARVLAFRYTADNPGALTGSVELTDSHRAVIRAAGATLTATGSLAGYTYKGGSSDKKPGDSYALALSYAAQVRVLHDGGTVAVQGERIVFTGVTTLTLILSAGTDFVQDRTQGWKGAEPLAPVAARLDAAAARGWDALLAEHLDDYQSLFGRVTLDLGSSPAAAVALTTDARLRAVSGTGERDPQLETLLFQYGRYLLIASSRPGNLPANLQGKWCNSNNPAWRCDYHTDVNIQMNYWPADAANLAECFQPYAEWVNSIRAVRTEATREAFNKPGWLMRGESGVFGGSTWEWCPGTSAWMLQNSYDHFRFTGDRDYLRTRAYPAMKEVCAYWIASLETLPDGTLVTPVGLSPEHGPRQQGISFDQQQVWDLFSNTIEAANVLGIDAAFVAELGGLKARLLAPQVGSWGQLLEWKQELTAGNVADAELSGQHSGDEGALDTPANKHRHVSHLVGLFPGRQISVQQTPAWAEAARVSLDARGDVSTGWSTANKINLWARLQDGDRAHKLIGRLFTFVTDTGTNMADGGGLYANLLDAHPPFQIDGNFGYTAGVCEMLLQSHLGELHLLPALPTAWAAAGSVSGLKARGGFTVDMQWADSKITRYRITSAEPQTVTVRVNGELKPMRVEQR